MKVLALLFAYGQSSHLHLHETPPRDDLSIRKSRVNYNERHIPLRNFTSICTSTTLNSQHLFLRLETLQIADFGCGEARLARCLPSMKVTSLDLVALRPNVTACDMANSPLNADSMDIIVFCLSLMGTNLRDYLYEANRVLKIG